MESDQLNVEFLICGPCSKTLAQFPIAIMEFLATSSTVSITSYEHLGVWLSSVEANINLITFIVCMLLLYGYIVYESVHMGCIYVCVSISDMFVPTSVYESCLKRKFSGRKFDEQKFGKRKFIERKFRTLLVRQYDGVYRLKRQWLWSNYIRQSDNLSWLPLGVGMC